MKNNFDFGGWATKNDLRCADGKIIRKDAFKDCDGRKVPLVWNHKHSEPENVLGHAVLENRDNGVYAYCKFNDTEQGKNAKLLVHHGDITALSIYANKLKQQGPNVMHGAIREVSLVIAGANPAASIDHIMAHSDGSPSEEEGIMYTGEMLDTFLQHAEPKKDKPQQDEPPTPKDDEGEKKMNQEKTVKDVFETLTEEQKTVVYALIGQALEEAKGEADDEGDDMKHNIFDAYNDDMRYEEDEYLSHSDMKAILDDGKRLGSLKEAIIEHGIENIDYLFPDARNVTDAPEFIKREDGWVTNVMNGTHHTPFSRIKSTFANITEDEARAKGYIKGKLKKEEVFSLLKRTTSPTTIYKKQKLDRDDMIDITDFDVVAWLKVEMRGMLNEEIARAVLVGDGRLNSDDDKINEMNIRPIWKDDRLYTIRASIPVAAGATGDDRAKGFIRSIIKARKEYKGSGNPTLFITEDLLTDCLLLTDTTGRDIYDSVEKLATKIRAKEIVSVPVFDNLERTDDENKTHQLAAILVNLNDYNVGADKGGAVNLFDDFDIDYNAQKYLIETRCSGALIKPYSAIVAEFTETEEAAG